jgi:hypothetical protein
MGRPKLKAGYAGTINDRAAQAAGAIETPRLIWAVNVNEVSKSGPKPLFWLSYRRPRPRPDLQADGAYMAVSYGLFKAGVLRRLPVVISMYKRP